MNKRHIIGAILVAIGMIGIWCGGYIFGSK